MFYVNLFTIFDKIMLLIQQFIFFGYYIKKKESRLKDTNTPHIPVLLNEVVEYFSNLDSGAYIDCTLGYGGHSYNILKNNSNLSLIGIDRDKEAIEFSSNRLSSFKDRVTILQGSFSKVLNDIDFSNVVALLADFGVSSLQLDKADRGFSFNSNVLDMRMDQNSPFSAKNVVNEYSLEMLTQIFREYGEMRDAKKVASKIVSYREKKQISSSKELADIISLVSNKKSKIHPATLAFQAIRMEVNSELSEIKQLLDILEEKRVKNLLVALITFHSLEDRLVKQRFKKWATKCICPPNVYKCVCGNNNNLGNIITKKPIIASKEEIAQNPRSRSAKLRIFRFNSNYVIEDY